MDVIVVFAFNFCILVLSAPLRLFRISDTFDKILEELCRRLL